MSRSAGEAEQFSLGWWLPLPLPSFAKGAKPAVTGPWRIAVVFMIAAAVVFYSASEARAFAFLVPFAASIIGSLAATIGTGVAINLAVNNLLPNDNVVSIAQDAFKVCIYCPAVTAIYAGADAVATSLAASVAASVKALVSSLMGAWVLWRLCMLLMPIGSDREAWGGIGRGLALFFLTSFVLQSYSAGNSGSVMRTMVYDPVSRAATGGSAEIIGGIASSMPNLGLPGGESGGCNVNDSNLGAAAACASWQAGRYAIAGLAVGYAMVVGKMATSDWVAALIPYVASVVFGLLLMAVWGWALIQFPIFAVQFVLRMAMLFAFSPLAVAALPFPSARPVIGKAIRGMVTGVVQMWGMGLVVGTCGAALAFTLSNGGSGALWTLVKELSEGGKRIYFFQPAYLQLLLAGILTGTSMHMVKAFVAAHIEDAVGSAVNSAGAAFTSAAKKVAGGAAAGAMGPAGAVWAASRKLSHRMGAIRSERMESLKSRFG